RGSTAACLGPGMRPGPATTGHAPQRRPLGHLTFHDSGVTWLVTAGPTRRRRASAQRARPPASRTPPPAGTAGQAAAAPRTFRVPLVRVDPAGARRGFGDAGDLAAQRVTPTAVSGDTGHHVTSGAGPDPYRSTRWPLPAHSVPSVWWRWIRSLLRPTVTTRPHTGHGWRVHSGARPRLTAAPPIPRRRRAAPSRATCAQPPPA